MNCSNISMSRSDASTRGRDARERYVLERGVPGHGHGVEAYGEGKEAQEGRLRDRRAGGDGFSPMAPWWRWERERDQERRAKARSRYEVRLAHGPISGAP